MRNDHYAGSSLNRIFFFLFVVSTVAFSFQRNHTTRFVHSIYSVEDGLPENSVSSIVRTSDGYLWIASQTLVRFDGKSFVHFGPNEFPSMPNSPIVTLFVDRDDGVWAGTYGGGVWRIKNDSLLVITEQEGLSNNIVRAIAQDSSGTMWFGTNSGVDSYGGTIPVRRRTEISAAPLSNIWALFVDARNNVWVGTYGSGVVRYDGTSSKTFTVANGLSSNMIMSLNQSADGTIWVGTDGGGLCSIVKETVRSYGEKEGMPSSVIWTIYRDDNGEMWFGTLEKGLFRSTGVSVRPFEPVSVPVEFLTSVIRDIEGNLWLGTQGRGLHKLTESKFTVLTTEDGLSGNNLRAVFKDSRERIWIGTVGAGITKYEKGKYSSVTTDDGLTGNFIWSFLEDTKGNIWVGTGGAGVNKISGSTITHYTTKDGLSNNFILSMLEDSRGTLWFGTNGGGLNKFSGGTFRQFSTANGLSNDFIVSLAELPDGAILIGTAGGGINILRDSTVTVYKKESGIHTNYIAKIFKDSEGIYWMFGGGGYTRWQNGNFSAYRTTTDLFSTTIHGVAEDTAGYFWFSGNKGLYRIKRSDVLGIDSLEHLPGSRYDKEDGIPSSEFGAGTPGMITAADGRLWIPTSSGLLIVDPYNIVRSTRTPPVYIEQFLVEGKPVSMDDQLQLSSLNRSFEFHYTAVSFSSPEKIRFRFRLEGFDEQWKEAGNRRTAYFTNLPYGDYRFQVIASNSDGVWNDTGASIRFTILPEFYETAPFLFAMAMMLTLAVVFGIRYRENSSKKREKELLAQVEERTKNLREEKERTEQALRETEEAQSRLVVSEKRYRNLIENINEAYFVLDPRGNIIYGSPNLSKEAGYSVDELMGKSFIELIAHEDRRRVLREVADLLRSGENDLAMEFRGLRHDGTIEWVEQLMRVVRRPDGAVQEYHNVIRKIDDRKSAEEALRVSEERYRKFFMNDLTGDFSATPDGTIRQVNTSFVKIFGFDSEQHAQRSNIRQLYSSPRQWDDLIKMIYGSEKIEYSEAEMKDLRGESVFVVQNLVGIFDDIGNLSEINGYIFDNTAFKRLEEQLLEAQKMESIGTLAGGIAHDFNNILAIILGYTQLLYRDKEHPEKIEKRANAIMGASERASDLVRQLLTFARKGEVIFEPINLNKIVKEVTLIVSETFPKTITVDVQIDHRIPEISAFGSHIHQALLNLCLNARDAMPDGGILKISTSLIRTKDASLPPTEAEEQPFVLLEISDSGMGMDAETKTRVFEPFFTTKERGRGTGLGLAVVYGIMQNHKGFIECDSKPGFGTTFSLYFPVLNQSTVPVTSPTVSMIPVARGNETLMLVEDEAMLVQLLEEHLENHGYTVLTAHDGLEAVELFEKNADRISLIITDLGLPRLGGWEAYKRMSRTKADVPVIIVSGYLEDSVKEEIEQRPGIQFISKPYSPEKLILQVRSMLDG